MVAIPKNAASTIQNRAPGPPAPIAVATPTIFPVPIVAESAVQSAPNEVTSPSPSSSFFTIHFRASGSLRTCSTPIRMVRRIPPAMIKIISGGPQTKSSTFVKKLLIASHMFPTIPDFIFSVSSPLFYFNNMFSILHSFPAFDNIFSSIYKVFCLFYIHYIANGKLYVNRSHGKTAEPGNLCPSPTAFCHCFFYYIYRYICTDALHPSA